GVQTCALPISIPVRRTRSGWLPGTSTETESGEPCRESCEVGIDEIAGHRRAHLSDQQRPLDRIAEDVEHLLTVMTGEGSGGEPCVAAACSREDIGTCCLERCVVVPHRVAEGGFGHRSQDGGKIQRVLGVVGAALSPGEDL